MTEAKILYEKGGYWVAKHAKGWLEVYKTGVTHSVRVATIDFRYDVAKQMEYAKREIERRLAS
jgi:hypothetical protein